MLKLFERTYLKYKQKIVYNSFIYANTFLVKPIKHFVCVVQINYLYT